MHFRFVSFVWMLSTQAGAEVGCLRMLGIPWITNSGMLDNGRKGGAKIVTYACLVMTNKSFLELRQRFLIRASCVLCFLFYYKNLHVILLLNLENKTLNSPH